MVLLQHRRSVDLALFSPYKLSDAFRSECQYWGNIKSGFMSVLQQFVFIPEYNEVVSIERN